MDTSTAIAEIRRLIDQNPDGLPLDIFRVLYHSYKNDPEDHQEFVLPLLLDESLREDVFASDFSMSDDPTEMLRILGTVVDSRAEIQGHISFERSEGARSYNVRSHLDREGIASIFERPELRHVKMSNPLRKGEIVSLYKMLPKHVTTTLETSFCGRALCEGLSLVEESREIERVDLLSPSRTALNKLSKALRRHTVREVEIRDKKGDDPTNAIMSSRCLENPGVEHVILPFQTIQQYEKSPRTFMYKPKVTLCGGRFHGKEELDLTHAQTEKWEAKYLKLLRIHLHSPIHIPGLKEFWFRGFIFTNGDVLSDVSELESLTLRVQNRKNDLIQKALQNGRLKHLSVDGSSTEYLYVPECETLESLSICDHRIASCFASTLFADVGFPNLKRLEWCVDSDEVTLPEKPFAKKLKGLESLKFVASRQPTSAERILSLVETENIQSMSFSINSSSRYNIDRAIDTIISQPYGNLKQLDLRSLRDEKSLMRILNNPKVVGKLQFLYFPPMGYSTESIQKILRYSQLPDDCLVQSFKFWGFAR
jgi:hypothetical protein